MWAPARHRLLHLGRVPPAVFTPTSPTPDTAASSSRPPVACGVLPAAVARHISAWVARDGVVDVLWNARKPSRRSSGCIGTERREPLVLQLLSFASAGDLEVVDVVTALHVLDHQLPRSCGMRLRQ
jgi:hypothetical protein